MDFSARAAGQVLLVCRDEESLGDISTLADPGVVKVLIEMRGK